MAVLLVPSKAASWYSITHASVCLDSLVWPLVAAPPGDSGAKRWPCRPSEAQGPKIVTAVDPVIHHHYNKGCNLELVLFEERMKPMCDFPLF